MKRKLLAMLLSLAMLFTLLPPGAAMAADKRSILVGDIALTGSANSPAYAITVDGAVQSGDYEQNYNIKWDGSTLTLANAVITTSDTYAISYSFGGNLCIELIGNNQVTTTSGNGTGIYVGGSSPHLTISAQTKNPRLEVTAKQNGILSWGGSLTIESGTIVVNGGSDGGIVAEKDIAINGGSITATSDQLAISAANSLTIGEHASVTAITTSGAAINGGANFIINGGEVMASSVGALAFTEYTASININPPENRSMIVQYGESAASATTQTYSAQESIKNTVANARYFHSYLTSISEPTITGVVVSPETATVHQGNSQQFTATVTGSGNLSNAQIQWSVTGSNSASSGTSISDSGLLTVAKDEMAESLTVTATVSDGDKTFSDTAAVTVTRVPVESVTVEPSEITLMVGETYQLTATVTPPEAGIVTWSSLAPSRVSVDATGLITAHQMGTSSPTEIRANVGSKYDECIVTVVTPNIYVGGVGFYSDGTTVAYGRTTNEGAVTTEGATAENYNIKWDGSTLTLRDATIKNEGGDGISSGTMTELVIEGQNIITATSLNNSGIRGSASSLTISGSGTLDVTGNYAGINISTLTLNSGTICAKATGTYGQGIKFSGSVIINGGSVMAEGARGIAKVVVESGDITINGGTVTAIGTNAGMDCARSNIVVKPSAGKSIAVTAGENTESAAALAGSPFTSETTITDLVSEKKYVHTEVKEAPPSITIQPQSATVTEGESVSFSLAASGSGLSYQWQQSSDGGQSWTAISGATSVSYKTGATTLQMNGTQYRCVITNAVGSVTSAAATLTVQEKTEPVDPDPTPTPDPDPTPTPDPEPEGPATDGSEGWTDIQDEITDADDGDEIAIDMNGETEVPKEIFESVAGKDVDVTFELEDGLSWMVNGTDIPTDADLSDLDLGVTMDSDGIPVNVINAITGERDSVQMTLAHDGEFGFTMTLSAPLGKKNAGLWANLYHYDENAEAMRFEVATEIDDDGNAALPMSHASQYAIVIDDHSHAAEEPANLPFTDVNDNDWFSDVVRYVYDKGLMTGTSDTEFSPNLTTTRGMIVSILNRLEGGPTAEAAGFTDVADGDWYADAVNWAASEGIVAGYEDNTFRPNDPITREQLAAMLMNYAAWKGEDVSARADLSGYNDAASVSSWAAETVQWAVAEGLISGMPGNLLEPQGSATRAQVAAILERFLEQ